MKDREFLIWLHERLTEVHGENHLVDYMHKLRAVIHATPADKTTRPSCKYDGIGGIRKFCAEEITNPTILVFQEPVKKEVVRGITALHKHQQDIIDILCEELSIPMPTHFSGLVARFHKVMIPAKYQVDKVDSDLILVHHDLESKLVMTLPLIDLQDTASARLGKWRYYGRMGNLVTLVRSC
jgi:hypothetical protein